MEKKDIELGLDGSKVEDPWVVPKTISIIHYLEDKIRKKEVREDFTCLDMCCGNGNMLYVWATHFPKARFVGLDRRTYGTWDGNSRPNITWEEKDLTVFLYEKRETWDITLMLNSFPAFCPFKDHIPIWYWLVDWRTDNTKFFAFDLHWKHDLPMSNCLGYIYTRVDYSPKVIGKGKFYLHEMLTRDTARYDEEFKKPLEW